MTTPQRIDGWAQSSPEGEWCGTDTEIVLDRERVLSVAEGLPSEGYRYVSVCLVAPARLQQLEAIEEWAKEAYKCFDEHKQATEAGDYEATRLFMKYNTITTAQADKQGEE